MSESVFRFKKFEVEQSDAAMKVGTDGVLLGAWVRLERDHQRFLDIGTGTGLIALMLAQRIDDARRELSETVHNDSCRNPELSVEPHPVIDAVEIEPRSARQAAQNTAKSLWHSMIRVHNASIQNFTESASGRYDNIVSNPPWFVDSLRPPLAARTTARHTSDLSYDELADCVVRLLAPGGIFSVVLPYDYESLFCSVCRARGLVLSRRTEIFTTPDSRPKRLLLELGADTDGFRSTICDSITISSGQHESFTEQYRSLTSPFYLKF